ncbi:CBO0543 family protein [Clostridium magnum]|nr:CBO0543 family protein [Clostridium magnum]
MLIVDIVFIFNKKLGVPDFIVVLTLMALVGIVHSLLVSQLHLYYYVSKEATHVYFIFYDIVVYPALAILFIRFLFIKRTVRYMIIYNIFWICFMTLFELLVVKPAGIIVYTGWRIIPQSIYFYSLAYPLFAVYYIKLKKLC